MILSWLLEVCWHSSAFLDFCCITLISTFFLTWCSPPVSKSLDSLDFVFKFPCFRGYQSYWVGTLCIPIWLNLYSFNYTCEDYFQIKSPCEGLRIRTSTYGLVWVGEIQFIPQHIQLVLNKVVACLLFMFEWMVSVQGINIYLITIWQLRGKKLFQHQ